MRQYQAFTLGTLVSALLMTIALNVQADTVTLIAPTVDINGNPLVDMTTCRIDQQGKLGQTGSMVISVQPQGGRTYPNLDTDAACPLCRGTGTNVATCQNSAGVGLAFTLVHDFLELAVPGLSTLTEP